MMKLLHTVVVVLFIVTTSACTQNSGANENEFNPEPLKEGRRDQIVKCLVYHLAGDQKSWNGNYAGACIDDGDVATILNKEVKLKGLAFSRDLFPKTSAGGKSSKEMSLLKNYALASWIYREYEYFYYDNLDRGDFVKPEEVNLAIAEYLHQ